MKKRHLASFLVIFLLSGFLLSGTASGSAGSSNNQNSPHKDVIVVFRGASAKSPDPIEKIGGKVTGSVDIIPAIFAKVPAKKISDLESKESVKYVETDSEVQTLDPPEHANPGGKEKLSVSWENPKDGDTVYGTVNIEISVDNDNPVENVKWKVDDNDWRKPAENEDSGLWEDNWDTTKLSDGKYDLTAKATDSEGNEDNEVITVTVNNEGDQDTPWGIDRIDAIEAAGAVINSDENNTDVAILDTGIDYDHEDLQNNVEKGADTTGGGPIKEGLKAADDKNGHGTHVAGTVAAENNRTGVIGAGPALDLYAVKVLNNSGRGTVSDVVEGIDWAVDHGAEVINMSLGSDSSSQSLEDACNQAYDNGVVLVAAAGNDGDGDPNTDEVDYPAAYENVVAVAATNKDNITPEFSSEGPDVEVSAPGENIKSTWLDDSYENHSGTSMASPHVSGTVGLMIAENNELTPENVRSVLHNNCIDIMDDGFDNYSGYGLIQADNAIADI